MSEKSLITYVLLSAIASFFIYLIVDFLFFGVLRTLYRKYISKHSNHDTKELDKEKIFYSVDQTKDKAYIRQHIFKKYYCKDCKLYFFYDRKYQLFRRHFK